MSEPSRKGLWAWIPTLYLAEGLPNALVVGVSVTMFKQLGISNTANAWYTSWIYLPWVIKPLWSPYVDVLGTRRAWIWATQVIAGAALAGVAFSIPAPHAFQWALAFFWLLAFDSATHDIAADGFYMLGTSESQQAFFVGWRNAAYGVATVLAQGPLVVLAGVLQHRGASVPHAWSIAVAVPAVLLVLLGLWHRFVLPRPAADVPGTARRASGMTREFLGTFGSFFRKPGIGVVLAFLLLYRLGEAQLVKLAAPFLLDARAKGGLGLDATQVGFLYGTIGIIARLGGGVAGGIVASRNGLKAWLWPMMLAIHLPDLVFIWLAWSQPTNLLLVQAGVAIEQFGYGFGFTAYTLYMIRIARGEHKTAHYAICTGFMALGLMLPGMWSGWLEDHIGYRHFFSWVVLATIPSFIVALFLPLEVDFARKPRESRV
jgi:PAT family beta-lactamase induction signal transducer AmpG